VSGYPYIRRQAVSLLVIAGLMVAVTAGPAVAAPPSGVVPGVDIVPPGQEFLTAWRVNNRGQVLLFLSGLIWQRGLYTDIGGLGGGFTGAFGINDAGDVVGDSDLADGTRGVVWRRGRALELDALGAGDEPRRRHQRLGPRRRAYLSGPVRTDPGHRVGHRTTLRRMRQELRAYSKRAADVHAGVVDPGFHRAHRHT